MSSAAMKLAGTTSTACTAVFTRPLAGRFVALCAYMSVWLAAIACEADQPNQSQLDFFERRIRPVLIERCYECHAKSGDELKGGLDLSFREGLLRGGDTGPALIPGKPNESLLIEALRYESYEMPPEGKLPDRVISNFVEWIEMGAPDPRTTSSTASSSSESSSDQPSADELWSLQPLREVKLPHVEGFERPIDRFVQARLLEAGIPFAPLASSRTLLRRLHIDLIGLPPGPDDVVAFQEAVNAGDHRKAIEDVVDQLLESPEFGERWARHWLDLTAYADTLGVGRAIPALEAWRYRDYVINAFNSDKPFDEFIRQQVAGDITIPPAPRAPGGEPPTAESIIATGFLAIGPWELVGGDKVQLRMDVVDKQLHRVGQTFLAMTFGCARCHDHKFDPISQHDYYALAGLFASTVTLNGRMGGVFSAINHRSLPETAEDLLARAQRIRAYEAEVASVRKARDAANAKVKELSESLAADRRTSNEESAAKNQRHERLAKQRDAAAAEAKQHAARLDVLSYLEAHRTEARALALMDAPEPEDCRINIRGNARQLGELVPRGFPRFIAPKDKPMFTRGGSGRVQLADWLTDHTNPLTARVWVNRIWHHLFGAGLVRTVDNFGARGETPSHPELLDFLAAEFMRDSWSTKRLIRRIVLSQTWQQASTNAEAVSKAAEQTDPENRLLWRANRRRLDAEAIRDSMLAVSGNLVAVASNGQSDRSSRTQKTATVDRRGGPTLPLDQPGNLNTALSGSLKPDAKFPERLKLRRSIYQPQKRKSPFDELDFLHAFDLPDPNQETGRRTVTTVPTQALSLLNSPFVKQCATATAKRFLDGTGDSPTRISDVYLTIYGRTPTANEVKEALRFVGQLRTPSHGEDTDSMSELDAWSRLCQSLLISNEFLFRD